MILMEPGTAVFPHGQVSFPLGSTNTVGVGPGISVRDGLTESVGFDGFTIALLYDGVYRRHIQYIAGLRLHARRKVQTRGDETFAGNDVPSLGRCQFSVVVQEEPSACVRHVCLSSFVDFGDLI